MWSWCCQIRDGAVIFEDTKEEAVAQVAALIQGGAESQFVREIVFTATGLS